MRESVCVHLHDTQKCDAQYQCIARVAPKFKYFGMTVTVTVTVQTRINLMIVIAKWDLPN